MSADDDNLKESSPTENRGTLSDAQLDDILKDPRTKETVLRKIALAEDGERHYLTPGGMSTGRWPPILPTPFWPGLFPPFPNAGADHPPDASGKGRGYEGRWAGPHAGEASSSARSLGDLNMTECRSKRARLMHEDEEDVIQL